MNNLKLSTTLFLVISLFFGHWEFSFADGPAVSIAISEAKREEICLDENCLQDLIQKAELAQDQLKNKNCLPPENIQSDKLELWYETHSVSAECYNLMIELRDTHTKLQKSQDILQEQIASESPDQCLPEDGPVVSSGSEIESAELVASSTTCNEEKQKQVWGKCKKDFLCVLYANATTMTGLGPLANYIMPEDLKQSGCDSNKDDCLKVFVLGFAKSVYNLLEGAWDLLKMAGAGIRDRAVNFYQAITAEENQSSTGQLALAEASSDPGFFEMLRTDFKGTMGKIWNALMAALKEWLKQSVFCQEWEGVPQFGKCLRPAQGIDCLECKAMVTGVCALSGTLFAEIVPAFLTGGIATAAKHGVSGASKIAKLFKVSSATFKAIQSSPKVVKMMELGRGVSRALRLPTVVNVTVAVLKSSVALVGRFMLSPAFKFAKSAVAALTKVASKTKTFVMLTPAGPVLTFGWKAAKTTGQYTWKGLKVTGKVVIFPIENPMTRKAFKIGEDFFENVFKKVGAARVAFGARPVLAGEAAKALKLIDEAEIEWRVAKLVRRNDREFISAAEKKLLEAKQQYRSLVAQEYINKMPPEHLLESLLDLFPELGVRKTAGQFSESAIALAERELEKLFEKLPAGDNKNALMARLKEWRDSGKLAKSKVTVPGNSSISHVDPRPRNEIVSSLQRGNGQAITVENLIREHFPELLYDNNSKLVGRDRLLEIESEFKSAIEKITDPELKRTLKKEWEAIVEGKQRARFYDHLIDFPPNKVMANAQLADDERVAEAFKLLNLEQSPEREEIGKAILKAHRVGHESEGVFTYDFSELRRKYEILEEAGLTSDQAAQLIRSGLAGRPPLRTVVRSPKSFFGEHNRELLDRNFLERRKAVSEQLEAFLEKQNQEKGFFDGLLKKNRQALTADQAEEVRKNLEAIYFVDYQHTTNNFWKMMKDNSEVGSLKIFANYEEQAFQNYRATREWLLKDKPKMDKDTFLEVQKRMMKDGVEGVTPDQLGKIRDGNWVGVVPQEEPISLEIIDVIQKNPYLTWLELGQVNGKYFGRIVYPNAEMIRPEALQLIKQSHPDLFQAIKKFQTGQGGDSGKLTQQLVEALLEERMARFNVARAKLGKINSPAKLDQLVDLLADFQRDLVSIHPLNNGNGRSTREFALYYPLMKEGLPPPRLLDPNADLYSSAEEWRKMVKQGILASDYLLEDLALRLEHNLPLENSLELFSPYHRGPQKLVVKKQGSSLVKDTPGVEYIDPAIYREVLKRHPELADLVRTNPAEGWAQIEKKAEEVFQRNNAYYVHQKSGKERLELGFVDDDYLALYGRNSYENPEAFRFKMDQWYDEEVTWRGLASTDRAVTEPEIIAMFKEFNLHMASNNVVAKAGSNPTPERIRQLALEDFSQYNDDVFGEGLVAMARDHSEAGPMYGISYGYSTSKNREVGKAFAMGAMVIGKYGEHKAPELQKLLKSRVLVGARRARKDVDLGRLKQLRPEFSYKYGRQQEVMGIGVAEPDAVSIIQTIDAEGEVILSYVRSPDDPGKILVMKGDYSPKKKPIKVIEL